MPESNLSPPRRSAETALNYQRYERRRFWRFYVLKRVFLQRATHLGTQTEYTYLLSIPRATRMPHEYKDTWACRARSERECELPAETQTLRGHNSAPHATQTLWPRLKRSSQRGEHICMKIPAFLRPSLSWHQSSSGFS